MFKLFDRMEEALAVLFLAGTVLAVLVGAVGRSVGFPVPMGPEIAQLLLIWTCMFGADLVLKRGEHIRISALPDALPVPARKALHLVCVLGMMGLLGYCAVLGWGLAMSNWARPMGTSGLSYGWVTVAFPVGCALMTVSLIRRLFDHGLLFAIEPQNRDGEQLL
jgi:TRAP-type C4-dicarboxylate transport system permease small subunit